VDGVYLEIVSAFVVKAVSVLFFDASACDVTVDGLWRLSDG
jgi:hypothetical protein